MALNSFRKLHQLGGGVLLHCITHVNNVTFLLHWRVEVIASHKIKPASTELWF
ncbi:hypothetical protein N473_24665 [Pseudoalteromonas luteoviolacea CPMOR-1]|uniref:Uncharacterized protein n=1 Tax=Pseudoalteromonas luteoviolacea CPMOR-1 TaxID=1365248 RepID=A0A167IWR0_9GAMM|nr:hypothetical protein N473_24665 [Pseudoalteromonas luteoviolacea CPMOR-1]